MSKEIAKELQEIEMLFKNDYLLEAYKKLQKLEEKYPIESLIDISQNDKKQLVLSIYNSKINEAIKEDYATICNVLQVIDSEEYWQLKKSEANIQLWEMESEEYQFNTVRIDAIIDEPLLSILVVLQEFDLSKIWSQNINQFKFIKAGTKFKRVLWATIKLFWPMQNRDILIQTFGCLLPSRNAGILVFQNLQNENESMELPTEMIQNQDAIRTDINLGCIYIQEHEKNKTKVTFIINADPQMDQIPIVAIELFLQQIYYNIMQSFIKECSQFRNGPYYNRFLSRMENYNDIRERLTNVLGYDIFEFLF